MTINVVDGTVMDVVERDECRADSSDRIEILLFAAMRLMDHGW